MTAHARLSGEMLTLEAVAAHFRMTPKSFAKLLKSLPAEPPLYAKPGRDYIIAAADVPLIYEAMKKAYGTRRIYIPELEAAFAKPPREDGSIYFIRGRSGGLIKIGWAVAPLRRIRALATGSTDELVLLTTAPGTRFDERDVHRKFAHLRRKGEWFESAPELLTFIRELGGRA